MSAPCRIAAHDTVPECLVEATVALVERVTGSTSTVLHVGTGRSVRIEAPVTFPDNIGSGTVMAQVTAREHTVRLELRLEHDRVFATPQKSPSPTRCFLNDYVASLTLAAEDEVLPEAFVREVVAGVHAARHAVERHNRDHPAPWFRIVVTARDGVTV